MRQGRESIFQTELLALWPFGHMLVHQSRHVVCKRFNVVRRADNTVQVLFGYMTVFASQLGYSCFIRYRVQCRGLFRKMLIKNLNSCCSRGAIFIVVYLRYLVEGEIEALGKTANFRLFCVVLALYAENLKTKGSYLLPL